MSWHPRSPSSSRQTIPGSAGCAARQKSPLPVPPKPHHIRQAPILHQELHPFQQPENIIPPESPVPHVLPVKPAETVKPQTHIRILPDKNELLFNQPCIPHIIKCKCICPVIPGGKQLPALLVIQEPLVQPLPELKRLPRPHDVIALPTSFKEDFYVERKSETMHRII